MDIRGRNEWMDDIATQEVPGSVAVFQGGAGRKVGMCRCRCSAGCCSMRVKKKGQAGHEERGENKL